MFVERKYEYFFVLQIKKLRIRVSNVLNSFFKLAMKEFVTLLMWLFLRFFFRKIILNSLQYY